MTELKSKYNVESNYVGRGGKREGGGRPKLEATQKKKKVSMMFSPELIEYLHSLNNKEHIGEKRIKFAPYIEALVWRDKQAKEQSLNYPLQSLQNELQRIEKAIGNNDIKCNTEELESMIKQLKTAIEILKQTP
jgi:hypothetical protein